MLTPKEISDKTFDKTFGYGYRMDDVDAYLDEAAKSMTEMMTLNSDLEKKLEVLADKLTEYREDEESLRAALLGAQKLGDSVIRESKTKAEIIMRDATIKAEAMVNSAKRQIEREQESLTQMQREVASFKNRLLDLYKQHLELISALPGGKDRSAPQPVQPEPITPSGEPMQPIAPDLESEPEPEQIPEPIIEKNPSGNSAVGEDTVVPPFFEENEEDDEEDDEKGTSAQIVADSKFGELKFGNAFKIPRNDKNLKHK